MFVNTFFQKSIRDELRQMSLEEIQALKESLGLKAYNRALAGDQQVNESGQKWKKREKREAFKRENKNRPREMSSKRAVPRLRDVVGVTAEQNAKDGLKAKKRDPRFEQTSGEFDRKVCTSCCKM